MSKRQRRHERTLKGYPDWSPARSVSTIRPFVVGVLVLFLAKVAKSAVGKPAAADAPLARGIGAISLLAAGVLLLFLACMAGSAFGNRAVIPAAQVVSGSGFFISPDGKIVTSAHGITGCQTVSVWLRDGTSLTGTVVASDTALDVALLQVPVQNAVYASAPNDGEPPIGSSVFVLGYGVLVKSPRWPVLSQGKYAGTADLAYSIRARVINAVLQRGQSGGPVIDQGGTLVGMVVGRSSDNRGRGIVLPTPAINAFLAAHNILLSARSPEPNTPPQDMLRAITVLVQCQPAAR